MSIQLQCHTYCFISSGLTHFADFMTLNWCIYKRYKIIWSSQISKRKRDKVLYNTYCLKLLAVYLCHLRPVHNLQRNAQHLLAFISCHIILALNTTGITGDAVSPNVPKQECKHPRSSSKNPQLRTFLECPNEPSPLCLQFQTDGNPAICPASVSLSGLLRGHTEEQRELEDFSSP